MNILDGLEIKYWDSQTKEYIKAIIIQTQITEADHSIKYFRIALMLENGRIDVIDSSSMHFEDEDIEKIFKRAKKIRKKINSRFQLMDLD